MVSARIHITKVGERLFTSEPAPATSAGALTNPPSSDMTPRLGSRALTRIGRNSCVL